MHPCTTIAYTFGWASSYDANPPTCERCGIRLLVIDGIPACHWCLSDSCDGHGSGSCCDLGTWPQRTSKRSG